MITVFSRIYSNKFVSEVNYYFHIGKTQFEVVYENISEYDYFYSKYTILLNFYIKNKDKVEVEMIRDTPIIMNNTRAKRKLSILSKFAFYIIMRNNDFNITKAINKVIYNLNGEDINLSPNSFLKSYYRLIPYFTRLVSITH